MKKNRETKSQKGQLERDKKLVLDSVQGGIRWVDANVDAEEGDFTEKQKRKSRGSAALSSPDCILTRLTTTKKTKAPRRMRICDRNMLVNKHFLFVLKNTVSKRQEQPTSTIMMDPVIASDGHIRAIVY